MRKFLLLLCVLSSMSGGGIAAPSESLELASQMAQVWKEDPQFATGIYEKKGFIFSVVTRNAKKASQIKNRQWATVVNAQQLFNYAIDSKRNLSPTDRAILKSSSGSLKVSGSIISNSERNGLYQYVFATEKQKLEKAINNFDEKKRIENQLFTIINHPERYQNLFSELKLQQLEALSRAALGSQDVAEITKPFATLADSLSVYKGKHAHSLITSKTKGFCPYEDYKTPILHTVCKNNGVVTFSKTLSDQSPDIMSEVFQRFKTGRELKLVIFLLEAAVEQSPRNAQIWEYLEAAYRADKQINKARMAAHVWYLLDAKNRTESIKRVLEQDPSSEAKEFLKYITNKGL